MTATAGSNSVLIPTVRSSALAFSVASPEGSSECHHVLFYLSALQ